MEGWERNIISSNLAELVTATTNFNDVLDELHTYDVFTFEEMENLRARAESQGKHAATKRMYNQIMDKPNSFLTLLEALIRLEQTNAYSIIVDEMETIIGYSVITYNNPLDDLEIRKLDAVRVLEDNSPADISRLISNRQNRSQGSGAARAAPVNTGNFRNAQTFPKYEPSYVPNASNQRHSNTREGSSRHAETFPQWPQYSVPQQPAHQRYATPSRQTSSSTARPSSSRSSSSSQPKAQSFAEEKIKFTATKENELGIGSGGTKVYRGTYGKRNVAVKQLTNFKNQKEAQREIDVLSKMDRHENVIRYHANEERADTILLALELAQATLETWIDDKSCTLPAELRWKDLLLQATHGLNYLHYHRVIHRDLKPNNILLAVLSPTKVLVKISDFGICRLVDTGRASKTITTVVGTEGWMAPEILKFTDQCRSRRRERSLDLDEKTTMTTMVDIFSLGCVFYYVLTDGEHPFGEADTEYNIKHGNDEISENSENLKVACNQHILQTMISQNPKLRPTTGQVLLDPIFWTNIKILQFLIDVSDFVEDVMMESLKPLDKQNQEKILDPLYQKKDECIRNLESAYKEEICQNYSNGWFHHICDVVREDLEKNKYNKLSYNSVLKLIRVIRNLRNHYGKLADPVQNALGSVPNEYLEYWQRRFPLLVYHVKCSFENLRFEQCLKSYYE